MKILILFLNILVVATIFSCGGGNNKGPKETKNIDSLLMKYPDSIPILLKHGNYYLKKYRFEKAIPSATKAFRLDSTNLETRILYADVLNNNPKRTIEDVIAAQRHFGYVLAKEPKNTKVLVGLASTFSLMQDFERSFQYINEALRIDKKYRDAYILKGTNYLQMGKIDLAKSSYETAVQQDPNFFEAYIALGNLYQEENNPVCMEYYTTAANLQPKNMDILYLQAYAFQTFGKEEQALEKYREMYKIDNDFAMAQFQQGYIKQFYQFDLDSAMIYYDRALVQEPCFVEAWHNLGVCWEDKKNVPKALQAYSRALKCNPNFTKSKEAANRII